MKKITLLSVGIVLVSVLFTGCGIKTSEYNVSADNVQKLRELKNVKVAVGDFTSQNEGESQIMCRLAETIATPSGEPFAKYIEGALKSELKMAGIYDKDSEIKITGELVKIYGSSMIGDAYWEIELKLASSTNQELKVMTKRQYPSAFLAYTACNNMATSFSPTVKDLVGEIIKHKDFISLVKNKI